MSPHASGARRCGKRRVVNTCALSCRLRRWPGLPLIRCVTLPPTGAATTLAGVLVTDYAVLGLKNGTEYRFRVAAVGPGGTTAFANERSASPTAQMDWKNLGEAFAGPNPPRSYCPCWILHRNESDEELRQFMAVAYRFGFEGLTLHPYDYQGFLEEGRWKRWRVILDQARKWGLRPNFPAPRALVLTAVAVFRPRATFLSSRKAQK